MSLLKEFTGSAGARRAREATAEANALLALAQGQARGSIDQSRAAQIAALQGGYDDGQGYLNAAETAATGRLNQGADAARGDIATNYDRAAGNVTDYYDRTASLLDPYISRGNTLANLYATALGANGGDQQQAFYADYAANDPYRDFRDEQANRALQQQFNARGQATGGRFASAVGRASLERGSQDLDNYLNRLQSAGQQGQAAATTLGNAAMQTGATLGQMNQQRGNTLAGIEQNRGQGLAGLVQSLGTTRANMATQRGQNIAGVEQNYGNSASNLAMGIAQQQGNNLIGGARAQTQARAGGINNLISLGGLALGAVTPGRTGVSALGNLANGMR